MNKRPILIVLILAAQAAAACTPLTLYPGASTIHTGWEVAFFQADQEIIGRDNQFQLESSPFLIQVSFPAGSALMINALDRDDNFYLELGMPCEERLNPFCPGMGVAEGTDPNLNTFLVLDPLGGHYLTETTRGRWWSLQDNGEDFTGRKMVRTLMVSASQAPYPQTPIEGFSGRKLYLIFYLEMDGDGKISENEIWKVVLAFK